MFDPTACSWHQKPWASCRKLLTQDRFPHALLLHGNNGLEKSTFGNSLANTILCQNSNKEPCNQCYACQLFRSGNHPDFQLLKPENNGSIKVNDTRKITDFLRMTDHYGQGKVTLILAADRMTQSAANSLLKILEEPPINVKILLVSSRPARLLPTILSRCQRIHFPNASREETIAWLTHQTDYSAETLASMLSDELLTKPSDAYATLLAEEESGSLSELHTDCLAFTSGTIELRDIINKWIKRPQQLIYRWLLDITRKDIKAYYSKQCDKFPIMQLYRLYDRQITHYSLVDSQLNPQLMLESALIEFRAVHRK